MATLIVATSTSRHVGEIGFLVGALGALLLVAKAALPDSGGFGRLASLAGPLLIAVGFVLGIVYIHGG